MHPLPLRPLLLLGTLLLASCAAPADDGDDAETSAASIVTRPDRATCRSTSASFTLARDTTSKWELRYLVSDVVRDGRATPGTFPAGKSPLGARFTTDFWNGVPLRGDRFVTETRIRTDSLKDTWGLRERAKCVVDLGPSPSYVDRFRLAYEYKTTGIYPERHDPTKLKSLGKAPAASLPANLARIPREYPSSTISMLEFEGKRIFEWAYLVFTSSPPTSIYHDFYDESGVLLAQGATAAQVFPRDTMMTPDEWEALPRSIWSWHK